MREGLVGLSHAVDVVLALPGAALLLGRITTQAILHRVKHGRLLAGSVLSAMFGCTILVFTNNAFGASAGVLMVGLGFASIYPLVVEKIGARFPYYHPGLFNGIFSIGLTGGGLSAISMRSAFNAAS